MTAATVLLGQKKTGGAFKTPSLRNVTASAPYMHDSSVSTLATVIDYYDRGGNLIKGKTPFIDKIGLTATEKRDLLEFLRTLNEPSSQATKTLVFQFPFIISLFHFPETPCLKGKACSIF